MSSTSLASSPSSPPSPSLPLSPSESSVPPLPAPPLPSSLSFKLPPSSFMPHPPPAALPSTPSLPPMMSMPGPTMLSMPGPEASLASSGRSAQDTAGSDTRASSTPNMPPTQASIMTPFKFLLPFAVFMMPPIVIIALFAMFPTNKAAIILGSIVSLWCLTYYTTNSPSITTKINPDSIIIFHSIYFYVTISQLDLGIMPNGFWSGLMSLSVVMTLYTVSVKPEAWASTFPPFFNPNQAEGSESQPLLDLVSLCQPPPPYQSHFLSDETSFPSDRQVEKMEEAEVDLL